MHVSLTPYDNSRCVCRYNGQFFDGLRNGYGVLHYATGARYEGCWLNDKKEGEGCYVFENGEVRAACLCKLVIVLSVQVVPA